jgi:2-keto-3-deoxy-L-rhamnonate aldolase RhmA
MYNDIENYIRFYSQLSVNLIVDFCFLEYVEFLQGIHHLTFVGDVDGIHDVFHGPMECSFAIRRRAKLDLLFLYLKSLKCSWNQVLKSLRNNK